LIKRKLSGLIFENYEPKSKKLFQNKAEDLNNQVNNLLIESNKSNKGKNKTINLNLINNPLSKNNLNEIYYHKKMNDNINENSNQGKENNIENNKSNANLNFYENALKNLNTKERNNENKKKTFFLGGSNQKFKKLIKIKKKKNQNIYFHIISFFLIFFLINLLDQKNSFGFQRLISQCIILCVKYMIYQLI
jgi:hypothetical protein